eukprot:scaffold152123_cov22-Tisochrysis_lutea.AAC.1
MVVSGVCEAAAGAALAVFCSAMVGPLKISKFSHETSTPKGYEARLSAFCMEKAGNSYLAGSKLTYADIAAFCYVCFLLSGMFAGEFENSAILGSDS